MNLAPIKRPRGHARRESLHTSACGPVCALPPPQAAAQASRHPGASRIHVIHADPVIVAVNARARDLIHLLQLLAADLADLPIRNQDLTVIA